MIALGARGDFSYGRAVGSPSEYAAAAAALGVRTLALTDVVSLAGQVEFHAACRACGVRPITGLEVPLAEGRRCLLLARDAMGYRNLCRLVKALRGREPVRDAAAEAVHHASGTLVLCDDVRTLTRFQEQGIPLDDLAWLRTTIAAAEEHQARREGYSVVPDTGVDMPRETDRALLLLKRSIFDGRMRAQTAVRDPRSLESLAQSPLDTEARVVPELAARCEFDLFSLRAEPGGDAAVKELRALCEAHPESRAPYRDRLNRELDVIGRMGLAPYFLKAHAVAALARRSNTSLVTRGSAVSSLVIHRLGLSPVDPIAAGLYFERFVRPSRGAPPDIDFDVPSSRRDELAAAVTELFGEERVAGVAAHQTFQRRGAFREALGALHVAPSVIERFCRGIRDDELELPPPLDVLPAEIRDRAHVIERLVDRPSHLSTHPSALFVADAPIAGALPLVLAPKGVLVTEYDGTALGRLGFSKLDLLGNHALAQLDEVASTTGLDLAGIPMDDAATLATIAEARTVGCHQLETPALRSMLCRLPIRHFDDLVDALALVRPAAGASEAKDAFVARARGQRAAVQERLLARLLPRTHGLILYEEDVISVIAATTGASPEAADGLRDALVRGEPVGPHFLQLAAANGLAQGDARQVWEEVARFAAYSFSKAHATSAATIAYLTAYAKTHHPAVFGCALLDRYGGAYPLRTIAGELVRSGLQVLPPSVNASEASCIVEHGAIRVGLDQVKHLTRATKARLFESRRSDGRFHTVADLERRVSLGRKEREALVMSGACDGLPPLSREAYPFAHFTLLGLPSCAVPVAPGSPDSERLSVYRNLVRIQNELELLGMHLVAHPMAVLRDEARRAGCLTSRAAAARPGQRVRFAGLVSALHHVKRGSRFITLVTFEDEHGFLEAVSTQRAKTDFRPSVDAPGPHLVEGRVRGEAACVRLEIDTIRPFHRRDDPYGHG